MVLDYSVAMPISVHDVAAGHLLRPDGQEDICFALWYPSSGATRTSAVIRELILPVSGDRLLHGNASFMPGFFERALGEAAAAGCGLALMHSHPTGRGWQDLSHDDMAAEHNCAPAVMGATAMPLVGLTLAGDESWSARFWTREGPRQYERAKCGSVRVVGDQIVVTYDDKVIPRPRFRVSMERTISAWGEQKQHDLARLHIAVVGAGSVGSMVAEALARTGVKRITLLDFDSVEPHNLDRLLHANESDAKERSAKVTVLARALQLSATARDFLVTPLEFSVAEPQGFRAALDADAIFSCVDRPWARSVLNLIAYCHLIPVIDGGVSAERHKSGSRIGRADWRAHLVTPGRRCMECLDQYDPGLVPVERAGLLDDPAYISALPETHTLRRNENVFAFSLSVASFELLQLLAATVCPAYSDPGQQMYHFVSGGILDVKYETCKAACLFPSLTAKGDLCGMDFTGTHKAAEWAHDGRARRGWRGSLSKWIGDSWRRARAGRAPSI